MKLFLLTALVTSFAFTSLGADALYNKSTFQKDVTKRDVVKETYVAKYLGQTSQEEWDKRGGNGQIISILSDGVTKTSTYANHLLQGKTVYSFPHTNVPQISETYDKGKLITKTTHFSSGLPEHEESLLPSGYLKVSSWYTDGVPSSVEEWNGSQLISGEYFDKNSELISSVKNGYGTRIVRDAFGTLLFRDQIAERQVVLKETFYPSGEPKSSTPYVNGHISGTVRTFLRGAEPSTLEEWYQGKKNGVCIEFENGEPVKRIPFVQGEKNGIEQHLKNGNQVVEEITWRSGKKHGRSCIYINGEPHEQWYYEDKRVNEFTFNLLTPTRHKVAQK